MKKISFGDEKRSRAFRLDLTIWLVALLLLILALFVSRPRTGVKAAARPELNNPSGSSIQSIALAPLQATSATQTPTEDPYPFGTPTELPTPTYDASYPGPGTTQPPTSTSASGTQAPNPTNTPTSPGSTVGAQTRTPTPFGQATGTATGEAAQQTQPVGAAIEGGEDAYLPLPSVTIIFPTQPSQEALLQGDRPPEYAALSKSSGSNRYTLSRVGPIAFIMLIWVLLGGWFYFSTRYIR